MLVWDLIKHYRNTLHGEAVLLKSVLICLGLIPLECLKYNNDDVEENKIMTNLNDQSITPFLKTLLGIDDNNNDAPCIVEIMSMSNLPQGSGMGGSSILGRCVLAAIGTLIGLDMSTTTSTTKTQDNLIHTVLALEQIMTPGGG